MGSVEKALLQRLQGGHVEWGGGACRTSAVGGGVWSTCCAPWSAGWPVLALAPASLSMLALVGFRLLGIGSAARSAQVGLSVALAAPTVAGRTWEGILQRLAVGRRADELRVLPAPFDPGVDDAETAGELE